MMYDYDEAPNLNLHKEINVELEPNLFELAEEIK
jgi:hypothetical protein